MAFRGILSFLGRAARVASPYVEKLVRLGEPLARIRRRIGARIAGVDADQLDRVIQAERAAQRQTAEIVGGDLSERISPDRLPSAITKQTRRFAWRIRYNYIDPSTGESIQRYFTLSTDDQLSALDAMTTTRDELRREYGREPFDLAIVRVTRADDPTLPAA